MNATDTIVVRMKKGNLAGKEVVIDEASFDPERHEDVNAPKPKVESMPKATSRNKTKGYEPKVNTK